MNPSENLKKRCGTIAILGLPNAGKSTLLNALVGFKLAPVHAKPQMTRKNILGIVTHETVQYLFLDTPGFQERPELLNRRMASEIRKSLAAADAVVWLIARDEPNAAEFVKAIEALKMHLPSLVVVSKKDLSKFSSPTSVVNWAKAQNLPILEVSAKTGDGLQDLLEALSVFCPEQDFLYPEDDVSDAPLREVARNIILESLMESLHQEIPYQCAVVIDEYREGPPKIRIRASIIVNRASQKGLVIGKGGQMLKKIGRRARLIMQEHFESPVVLDLFVKVDEGWIKNETKIEEFS